jgi:hypothetical protein
VIMRKILVAAAAIVVVGTAAGVAVVAAAYALFTSLESIVGPAWAEVVVAVAAVIVATLGVVIGGLEFGRHRPKAVEPSLTDTVVKMARERPLAAAGAALAAGLIALKNPGVMGAVLSAFLASRPPREPRR